MVLSGLWMKPLFSEFNILYIISDYNHDVAIITFSRQFYCIVPVYSKSLPLDTWSGTLTWHFCVSVNGIRTCNWSGGRLNRSSNYCDKGAISHFVILKGFAIFLYGNKHRGNVNDWRACSWIKNHIQMWHKFKGFWRVFVTHFPDSLENKIMLAGKGCPVSMVSPNDL